jgi:hypothetical protein
MSIVLKDFKCKVTKKFYKAGQEYDGDRTEELQELGYVQDSESVEGNLDIKDMKYQQLKKLAKEMGLDATGKAEDLIARIEAVKVTAEVKEDDDESGEGAGTGEADNEGE